MVSFTTNAVHWHICACTNRLVKLTPGGCYVEVVVNSLHITFDYKLHAYKISIIVVLLVNVFNICLTSKMTAPPTFVYSFIIMIGLIRQL